MNRYASLLFTSIFLGFFILPIILFVAADMETQHEHVELPYIQFYTFTYCPEQDEVYDEGYREPTKLERRRIEDYNRSM